MHLIEKPEALTKSERKQLTKFIILHRLYGRQYKERAYRIVMPCIFFVPRGRLIISIADD